MSEELEITFAQGTDVGKVRDHNEDCVAVKVPTDPEERRKGRLFIVADGMGGYQAGEVASQIAADTVRDRYYADPSEDPTARLVNAVQTANGEVHRQAQNNPSRTGMGTTIVATALIGRKAYIASVGDSRAYVIHKREITQITQDHSFVGEQVKAGILTKEQARTHPQRNVITRALGSQPTVQVDTFVGDLADGDTLLMCTDGLTGHVPEERIRDVASHLLPEQAIQQLIQLANEGGGTDNISVIVLRAGPVERTKPVAAVSPPAVAVNSHAATMAARPAGKGGASLIWIVGGVVVALIAVGIVGAVALGLSGVLRSGVSSVTPTVTLAATRVFPTVTPLAIVPMATSTPQNVATSTLAPTPTPVPPTNTPRPIPTAMPSATATQVPPTPTSACTGGRVLVGGQCVCPTEAPEWLNGRCVPKGSGGGGGGMPSPQPTVP